MNVVGWAADPPGYHERFGFAALFSFIVEGNIPSTFSGLVLAATALVAARLAQAEGLREGERNGWRIFAFTFLFLAVDETTQLHEALNPIGWALGTSGAWRHIGVFPYALLALCLGLALFPFWARQSRPVKWGIAAAGIAYVAATVGIEMPENMLREGGYPSRARRLVALNTVEEWTEMIAVAVFLRCFLIRFVELGGGSLLALVGARPMLAIEIVQSEKVDSAQPVAVQAGDQG
jgi:hypothetical protein